MARHLLTDKDVVALTATCSIDGVVRIRPIQGGRSYRCVEADRVYHHEWAIENPEKAAVNRGHVSAHRLTSVDTSTRRGVCPVDGEVDITPWNPGWACAIRAAELRTKTQEPTPRCEVCNFLSRRDNPVVDGRCEFHRVGLTRAVKVVDANPVFDSGKARPVSLARYETTAAKVPARESAVPGWQMTGQNVPADEWAKWESLLASEGL